MFARASSSLGKKAATNFAKKNIGSFENITPKLNMFNDPFSKLAQSTNSKVVTGLSLGYNTVNSIKDYKNYAEKAHNYLNNDKTAARIGNNIMTNFHPSSLNHAIEYHGGKIYKFKKYSKKNRKTKRMCKNRRTRRIKK